MLEVSYFSRVQIMGNGLSFSEDEEHPRDANHYHGYDEYDVTDLEDEKDVVEKRVRLPPHHRSRNNAPMTRMKALVDDQSTRASGSSTSIEDNSRMTYDYTETVTTGTYNSGPRPLGTTISRQHSLVSSTGPPRQLYDTDDVSALTDMAHDGDDEATNRKERRARWARQLGKVSSSSSTDEEEEETIMILDAEEEYSRAGSSMNYSSRDQKNAKQKKKGSNEKPERKSKKRGEEHDSKSHDGSVSSDKENGNSKETESVLLVEGIVGATVETREARVGRDPVGSVWGDDAYVNTAAPASKPTDDAISDMHAVVPVTSMTGDNASHSSIATRSTRDSVVHVAVAAALDADNASLSSKKKWPDASQTTHNHQSDPTMNSTDRKKAKARISTAPDGVSVTTFDTHSTRNSAVHDLTPVVTDAVNGARVSSTKKDRGASKAHRTRPNTESSAKKQATARIIVPAEEVSRKGPVKIVIASDVETSPQHQMGCMPAQLAAKTDVFFAIPTEREATTKRKQLQKTVKKASITVVVASDVETSPQHRLGCMPTTAAPKTDIFHSFARQQPPGNYGNVTVPDTTALQSSCALGDVPVVMNGKVVGSRFTRQQQSANTVNGTVPDTIASHSSCASRDVPVVINGKIVGSRSSWFNHKPKPESPKGGQDTRDERHNKSREESSAREMSRTTKSLKTEAINARNLDAILNSEASEKKCSTGKKELEANSVAVSQNATKRQALTVMSEIEVKSGATSDCMEVTNVVDKARTESNSGSIPTVKSAGGTTVNEKIKSHDDPVKRSVNEALVKAGVASKFGVDRDGSNIKDPQQRVPIILNGKVVGYSAEVKGSAMAVTPRDKSLDMISKGNAKLHGDPNDIKGNDEAVKHEVDPDGQTPPIIFDTDEKTRVVVADPDGKAPVVSNSNLRSPNKKNELTSTVEATVRAEVEDKSGKFVSSSHEKSTASAQSVKRNELEKKSDAYLTTKQDLKLGNISPSITKNDSVIARPVRMEAGGTSDKVGFNSSERSATRTRNQKVKTIETENNSDTNPTKTHQIKISAKTRSPQPDDGRLGKKSATQIAELIKIASNDSRDLQSAPTDDFDGIDFTFVEQYEEAFDALLEKHPEFMAKNPKLVETLRVAKLQKLLSVAFEVENELEDYVQSLSGQKDDVAAHYHTKLLEATKKKASREIILQEALEAAQRDTRVLEGQLTWQIISQCEAQAKQYSKLQTELSQQTADAANPLSFLPDNLSHVRESIRDATQQANNSHSEVQLQQLQVDKAFLYAQATALEKRLAYLQVAAKKYSWVDSVFRRLDAEHFSKLKQRYQDKLGLTF